MTTLGLLLGGGIGVGLWCIARGLRPPRASLPVLLARLTPAPAASHPLEPATTAARPSPTSRLLGSAAVRLLDRLGMRWPHHDLALVGRSAQQLAAEQATGALLGLLAPPALAAALTLSVGVAPSGLPLAGVAVGSAIAGWLLPQLTLRQQAAAARRDLRHALGAMLDVCVISLAGGAGVEGALHHAAQVGADAFSAELRRALEAARLNRQPPWTALADLGDRYGVSELTELAASLHLAGAEGARVRASLTAKAATLRARQHAQTETDAQAATERMVLPLAVMLTGYLLLLGYPAVANVLTSAS